MRRLQVHSKYLDSTLHYFATWEGAGSRYLPGIALPENIIAEPDVKKAAEGAHILVWVHTGCVAFSEQIQQR